MAKAGSAEVSLTPKRREIHSPFFKFHRLTLFFKNAPSSSEKWQECVIHILVQIYVLFFSIYNTFFCFFPLNSLKISGKNSKWKGSKRGKGERRARFPKDPDAPKKPVTAYILYFKDRKQLYVDQNQSCF